MRLKKVITAANQSFVNLKTNLNSRLRPVFGVLALGILLTNAVILFAQKAQTTDNKADSNLKSSARVNPSTLAMEFSIPLGSYPGRGGNSIPFVLNYSSKLWKTEWANFHYDSGPTGNPLYPYYYYQTTDVIAKYGDKSIAGWTSSLQPPTIIQDEEIYNQFGETFQFSVPQHATAQLKSGAPFRDYAIGDGQFCAYENPQIEYDAGCMGLAYVTKYVCCPPFEVCSVTVAGVDCAFGGGGEGGGGGWGWGGGSGGSGGPTPTPTPVITVPTPTPQIMHMVKRVRVQMPDGSSHEFRKDDKAYNCYVNNLDCNSSLGFDSYLSVDGSGMRLEKREKQPDMNNEERDVLYMPNGSKYIFANTGINLTAEKYVDVNGNTSAYNNATHTWTDTLGREIKNDFPDFSTFQVPPLDAPQSIKLKGINNQDVEYKVEWKQLDTVLETSGTQLRYPGDNSCSDPLVGAPVTPALFSSEPVDHHVEAINGPATDVTIRQRICNKYGTINSSDLFNPIVMGAVQLPNGSKYQFKYNEYGEITKIIYPTGGYERFVYGYVAPLGVNADMIYKQGNRGVYKRFVSFNGSTEEQEWTYEPLNSLIRTIAPDGSKTERELIVSDHSYFGFEDPRAGIPSEERGYDTNGTLRSRTLSDYTVTPAQGADADQNAKRDARPVRQISITIEGGKALATMSETEYETPGENGSTAPTDLSYFARLNVKQTKSYHYLPLDLPTAQTGDTNTIKNLFYSSGQLSSISQTDYKYDLDYRARGIIGLPIETRSLNPANPSDILAKSQTLYDEPSQYYSLDNSYTAAVGYAAPTTGNVDLRGNPTTSRTWVKETGTWLQTHAQFDNFGNLRKAWDITGDQNRFVETQYGSQYNYAYPTKVITPAPDPDNSGHGTTEGSTVETTYDPTTGLPLTVKDDFGQITATEYDSQMRPWRVYGVNFAAPETQTIYGVPNQGSGQFTASERFVKVRKQIDANNWDEATTWFDGLGRTIKTQAKDSQGDVFVETKYDEMGRASMVTNPYRANDEKLWNLTEYDAAGRAFKSRAPVANQNPDNPTGDVLGTTSFDISTAQNLVGTVVTSTDAANRPSRSFTNALGQLLRVDEPSYDNKLVSLPTSTPLPTPNPSPSPTVTPNATPTPYATPNPTPNPTPGGGGSGGCYAAIDRCLNGSAGATDYPSVSTYYTYNALGKMVKVNQGGQNRFFLYDSFGRMIRVRQPEQEVNTTLTTTVSIEGNNQWTAKFTYDTLGNLITTTDSKGTVITNTYDKAGRVITRTYSNEPAGITTPAVSYFYDGKGLDQQQTPVNYAKGKLTKVTSTISETRYRLFDNLGRLKEMEQRTPFTDTETVAQATPRVSKYEYNFAGALVSEEYPSGRIVKNNFKADGDLLNVESRKAAASQFKTYVSDFTYTAAGGIKSLKLGNGRWETAKFNDRLQVTELGLGSSATDAGLWKVNYDYGEMAADGSVDAAKNTGNIARQTISFTGLATPFVQAYKYDSLNRLKEARETSGTNQTWIQNFEYDRYGNRTAFSQNVGGIVKNQTPATLIESNRFDENQGFLYDKNGNIKTDVDPNSALSRDFIFDGENKQIEVKQNGVPIGKYFYDGEGKRVKKVTDLETTIFVYSAGKLVAEYSTQLSDNPSINYTTTDHLGSPRVITDQFGQVKARRDFMPFGEELYAGIGNRTGDAGQKYSSTKDDTRQKFTGYQNDKETNLDFAEARYYDNGRGRFTAVDPLLASGKSSNPQTFNRYTYVSNNPIMLTDPTGLFGDYYSRGGKRLGTDSIDDGKVYFADYLGPNKERKGYVDLTNIERTSLPAVWHIQSWYSRSIPSRTPSFLDSFPANPYEQAATGAAKGLGNIGIGLWNFGTWLAANNGRTIPTFDNPLAVKRFSLDTPLERNFGYGVEGASLFAGGVAAAPFRAGTALSVVPESASTLAGFGSDAAIIQNSANLIPKKGWYDAVVHGTEDGLNFTINGKVTSPNEFYGTMLQNGYRPGTNVRLMSCFSGSCSNGAAQQLSNLAGAKVVAPVDAVHIGGGGVFTRGVPYVSNGKWFSVFRPQ